MRTIEPILTAGIAVAVILGMIVPNIVTLGRTHWYPLLVP